MSKKPQTVQRTDDNVMKISLSFWGAVENLRILDTEFIKNNSLSLLQYVSYLSQLALCVELGMKTILINKADILKTHDLKKLYNKLPKDFHYMFEKKYTKQITDNSLNKMKNMFEDFRYMNIGNLGFFLDKSVFTPNSHNDLSQVPRIDLSQVKKIDEYQFIYFLLDKIIYFCINQYDKAAKNMDFTKLLNVELSFEEQNKIIDKLNKEFNDNMHRLKSEVKKT